MRYAFADVRRWLWKTGMFTRFAWR